MRAAFCSTSSGLIPPATMETTHGCASGNCNAAVASSTSWRRQTSSIRPHAIHDLSRRGLIMRHGTRHGAGGENPAIERAGGQDRDALPFTFRNQIIERALFEQSVSARQHDTVDFGLTHETQRHGAFVETDANGLDDASPAQLNKRRKATGHRLLEALVGGLLRPVRPNIDVVNENHVDAVQPKAQ